MGSLSWIGSQEWGNTRNKEYANFIMKCMECMVLFNFYLGRLVVQDFYWNIGETEVEIQTEVQENAGLRWALLGFGRTHGSADPRVAPLALSLLCMVRPGVVCWVRYVLLPHTGLLPVILFKNIWKQNKTLPVWKPGSWSFIELSNMGAHYNWREIHENKYWKVKW